MKKRTKVMWIKRNNRAMPSIKTVAGIMRILEEKQ